LPPPRADPRTDAELVDALNDGDTSAFEALYYRYRDWVVRLAVRFAGNDDDALDVLQETFSYVLRKFPGFRLTSAMTTFLYPVVKHLALAGRRKRQRMVGDDAALASAADRPAAPDSGAARAELAAVVAGLPETHREVLLMRFVDAMSLEEISTTLEIPVGTVKSRLHNAIAMLKKDPKTRAYFNP
jgi:RNA polymerase sigma-70 factor (ECF subfamily)